VSSEFIWEVIHLLEKFIKGFFNFSVDVPGEKSFIDGIYCLPDFVDFSPNAL
jgi:hypothetical protein